ncbi:probable spastin homolog Bm1_53365 [Vitis riparia]|uniref:probable spastin homolog Bm1_53365 n=1 Tax=Vitis riparia TaxID=96939 RepID=UPI00155AF77F|nr:probable spastin homolog Bm1_53365 [Vitis riparia]XP_034708162.1 probable spastin homolog Bm1_53365 [Vitis riparia]
MENLAGLGTKEIERVMVLAVTNRPFDLDEAIIKKFPHRLMVGLSTQSRESLCGTVAAANCPLRESLEEEKKVWFPFLTKREGKKKKFMHFCFESK